MTVSLATTQRPLKQGAEPHQGGIYACVCIYLSVQSICMSAGVFMWQAYVYMHMYMFIDKCVCCVGGLCRWVNVMCVLQVGVDVIVAVTDGFVGCG